MPSPIIDPHVQLSTPPADRLATSAASHEYHKLLSTVCALGYHVDVHDGCLHLLKAVVPPGAPTEGPDVPEGASPRACWVQPHNGRVAEQAGSPPPAVGLVSLPFTIHVVAHLFAVGFSVIHTSPSHDLPNALLQVLYTALNRLNFGEPPPPGRCPRGCSRRRVCGRVCGRPHRSLTLT